MGTGQVGGFIGVLYFEFGNHLVNAGTGDVGNGAVTGFIGFGTFFQNFGHLHANTLASTTIFGIQLHKCVGCCTTSRKEIYTQTIRGSN